jgi:magnesium transporter
MTETLNPSRPNTPGDARATAAAAANADFGAQTAGRIMTRDVFALDARLTVEEAIERLRERADADRSPPHYVYAVDAGGRVSGVISMRDLALSRPVLPLSRVMRTPVESVRADADQEDVAKLMQRDRYSALPVVDGGGSLLGVVTVDSVMDVIDEEATEDVQRMFGAGPEERLTGPWHLSVRKRLPWLLVNLVLAFVAASVIRAFEATVAAWAVLAVYMPIVAGMGGNASAQAMSVAIRGISVGDARRIGLRAVIGRELRVGIASGLLIGVIAGCAALVFHGGGHGPMLPILVAASLLINHVVGPVWGASVPFVMARLGFDPAQSATIFTSTLTDVLGFLTLLGLAAAAMHVIG